MTAGNRPLGTKGATGLAQLAGATGWRWWRWSQVRTRTLYPNDPDYPEAMSLLELLWGSEAARSPPLYLRGTIPTGPGIAVVGTRKATQQALAFTGELVKALAEQECSIWSGGAYGVDESAHEAALAAAAPTVVVTAGGLDDPYPSEHAELYARVVSDGGALISLQPDGATRRRHQFVQRNYVLAALTLATVVIQAPARSGARYTAGAARKLAKPLFVVPGEPWSKRGAGGAIELVKGATPIACADHLTVALAPLLHRAAAGSAVWLTPPKAQQTELWPSERSVARPGAGTDDGGRPGPTQEDRMADSADPSWGGDAARVLTALGDAPTHADSLCTSLELSYRCVCQALLTLCLHGVVVEAPPGHYRRVR
jgi:DNA processing protein